MLILLLLMEFRSSRRTIHLWLKMSRMGLGPSTPTPSRLGHSQKTNINSTHAFSSKQRHFFMKNSYENIFSKTLF
jgi:hypothetical protein